MSMVLFLLVAQSSLVVVASSLTVRSLVTTLKVLTH